MMPLLAPGVTFHSNSSSKLSYLVFAIISVPCSPRMLFNTPSSTFQDWSGNEFILNPRHLSTDLPLNRTSHLSDFAFASAPRTAMGKEVSEKRTVERIRVVWRRMGWSVV